MAKRIVPTEPPGFDEPLDNKVLGRFVRARRTQMGIDIQTAAMLCGVSLVTLQKLESGADGTRLSTALKVCSALGVRISVEPWESE